MGKTITERFGEKDNTRAIAWAAENEILGARAGGRHTPSPDEIARVLTVMERLSQGSDTAIGALRQRFNLYSQRHGVGGPVADQKYAVYYEAIITNPPKSTPVTVNAVVLASAEIAEPVKKKIDPQLPEQPQRPTEPADETPAQPLSGQKADLTLTRAPDSTDPQPPEQPQQPTEPADEMPAQPPSGQEADPPPTRVPDNTEKTLPKWTSTAKPLKLQTEMYYAFARQALFMRKEGSKPENWHRWDHEKTTSAPKARHFSPNGRALENLGYMTTTVEELRNGFPDSANPYESRIKQLVKALNDTAHNKGFYIEVQNAPGQEPCLFIRQETYNGWRSEYEYGKPIKGLKPAREEYRASPSMDEDAKTVAVMREILSAARSR